MMDRISAIEKVRHRERKKNFVFSIYNFFANFSLRYSLYLISYSVSSQKNVPISFTYTVEDARQRLNESSRQVSDLFARPDHSELIVSVYRHPSFVQPLRLYRSTGHKHSSENPPASFQEVRNFFFFFLPRRIKGCVVSSADPHAIEAIPSSRSKARDSLSP